MTPAPISTKFKIGDIITSWGFTGPVVAPSSPVFSTKGPIVWFLDQRNPAYPMYTDEDRAVMVTPFVPPLDLTKPVQTRDGYKVRILCIDGPSSAYPVVGIIGQSIWRWSLEGASLDGMTDYSNLINVPPEPPKPRVATHKVTVFLCEAGRCGGVPPVGSVWITKRKPSNKHKVIGTKEIEVTITEGEGMSPQGCKGACVHKCECR